MIAVLGIPSETPVRLLLEACAARHLPCTLFNQRRQDAWRIEYDSLRPHDSQLENGEVALSIADCSGLYLRTMAHSKVPEWTTASDRPGIEGVYSRLWRLLDDAEIAPKVVNSPSVQLSNNSKPYQSIVIREQGLDIPETCITSDEDVARSFFAEHPGAIYKSISGTRSIVKRVDDASLANLSRLRYCPVQFQEFVSGVNVRVHVVGDQAIATRIESDAVDYRYAAAEGKAATLTAHALGADTTARCIALAQALNLPFAGIDLMLADDGRTVCFEVNPSPGYSYYELHTGQRISHALADLLQRPAYSRPQ